MPSSGINIYGVAEQLAKLPGGSLANTMGDGFFLLGPAMYGYEIEVSIRYPAEKQSVRSGAIRRMSGAACSAESFNEPLLH